MHCRSAPINVFSRDVQVFIFEPPFFGLKLANTQAFVTIWMAISLRTMACLGKSLRVVQKEARKAGTSEVDRGLQASALCLLTLVEYHLNLTLPVAADYRNSSQQSL